MLRPDDPWLVDDPVDGASDLFQVLPELRPYVTQPPRDQELGLRSLLEQPEAFAHSWWRDQARRSGRTSAGSLRPHAP
jgi:hypothetical protein